MSSVATLFSWEALLSIYGTSALATGPLLVLDLSRERVCDFRQHGHRRAQIMAHGRCPKSRRTGASGPGRRLLAVRAMTSTVSRSFRSIADLQLFLKRQVSGR
jgi:hypothetical protein